MQTATYGSLSVAVIFETQILKMRHVVKRGFNTCFNDRTILSDLAAAPVDRTYYGMHK
jgi:hypothetical protein